MHYFAPKNPQNISLKAGNNTTAEVVGIDFLYNQKWFDNNNAHLVNITFRCKTGEIIVQKEQVTLNELGNIAKLYKAITGKDVDPNIGFSAKEIMNKQVVGTISDYIAKNGTRYVRLKDYKAV
ncbi:MAG: hypothetical protein ACLVEC_03795 [Romboutsia timonensis]|jgi:hypothetical protein|uniref:hypothetical protein n=1 Tax=Romboutsia timonensis TaxID=1776391 RepID=UPI003990AD2F